MTMTISSRESHTVPQTFLYVYQAVFSSRVPGDREPNRLTLALRRRRATASPLIDLTRQRIRRSLASHIRSSILDALGDHAFVAIRTGAARPAGGARGGRRDYARRGIKVAPDRIVLTASTSEAYSLLFKLLCEPAGDARDDAGPELSALRSPDALDGVRSMPYRLEYHGRWAVDLDELDAAGAGHVRAVLAVSPNNPTGSVLTDAEMAGLAARCAARGAALILDEVFVDYPLSGARSSPSASAASA